MGIREVIDRNPRAATAIGGLVAVVAIALVAVQLLGNKRGITSTLPDAYFTDDDGKTFFADSPTNVPPFDHNGKTAVSAYVYRAGGKEFVAYMSRYTPEARKRIVASKKVTAEDERFGRELKKPGAAEWIKATDLKKITALADVKGPNGQTDVEPIEPGM